MGNYNQEELSYRRKNPYTRHKKCRLPGIILWITCLLLLAGCGSQEEEIPMGRYAEREVTLPGSGYTYMHPLGDGSCYLYGDGVDLTMVTAEGESSQDKWLWENTSNIYIKYSYGVSDSGAVVFGYTPLFYADGGYEDVTEEGQYRYLYYYVDADGNKTSLALYGEDYQPTVNLQYFAFAPDERLYAASSSAVYRIQVDSGKVESLFGTAGQVNEFAFVGDTMIALDAEKAYLYDMAGEKLLENNSVLSEFVASHQTGDKSIVLAAEAEQVLYLGCRSGLYRYVWNGSVIEQIADGQMLTFGNSQYTPCGLQALPEGEFRALFSGNYMVEIYYDESIPSRPSEELVVYSLEDNGRIRYAAQLFQKLNPDVLVTYETGADGDNAVSTEDALKNLNTRLLAGEGPDVLIMDGMDIEQYAGKGMLRELDGLMAAYEEGTFYQGIIDGMRMTEDEKLYVVPMTVYLPVWGSEAKYLEGEESLDDIVAGLELARTEHPDGPLLFTPREIDVLQKLMPVCLPAWTEQNGSLDTEKLTAFYQAAQRIWELDSAGMSGEERAQWRQRIEEIYDTTQLGMIGLLNTESGQQYVDYMGIGKETWAMLGIMENTMSCMTYMHSAASNSRQEWYIQDKDAGIVMFDRYIGQAKNVYWARTIAGINSQAKEPELAEAFLKLLLSKDMQDKWWLDGGTGDGLVKNYGMAVRKESVEWTLNRENREYAQVKGWSAERIMYTYSERTWPDEEEKQWLYRMLEEADCLYLPDTMLEKAAEEVGLLVLDGSLTPEEGAQEVARRMAIAMEE